MRVIWCGCPILSRFFFSCLGEIVWHNIDPSIVAGFCIVRVPGIVRVNFRDTYPHYIGPPTVLLERTFLIKRPLVPGKT